MLDLPAAINSFTAPATSDRTWVDAMLIEKIDESGLSRSASFCDLLMCAGRLLRPSAHPSGIDVEAETCCDHDLPRNGASASRPVLIGEGVDFGGSKNSRRARRPRGSADARLLSTAGP